LATDGGGGRIWTLGIPFDAPKPRDADRSDSTVAPEANLYYTDSKRPRHLSQLQVVGLAMHA